MNLLKPDPRYRRGFKDPKRMAAIHNIGCSACLRKGIEQTYPTEAHHKIGMGMGLKASDLLTMSLCDLHHNGNFIRSEDTRKINGWSIHKTPLKRWQEKWGSQDELIELTNKLLDESSDY